MKDGEKKGGRRGGKRRWVEESDIYRFVACVSPPNFFQSRRQSQKISFNEKFFAVP